MLNGSWEERVPESLTTTLFTMSVTLLMAVAKSLVTSSLRRKFGLERQLSGSEPKLSLIPRTHARQLTTACETGSRGIWHLELPALVWYTHTHLHTFTHTCTHTHHTIHTCSTHIPTCNTHTHVHTHHTITHTIQTHAHTHHTIHTHACTHTPPYTRANTHTYTQD